MICIGWLGSIMGTVFKVTLSTTSVISIIIMIAVRIHSTLSLTF